MRSSPSALLRVGILFASPLLCATITLAQFSKLDDLASQLTKELKPFKPIVVAVVDFRPADGSTVPQGHYFAWILSSYLQERAKNKFAVANHFDFDKDLANLNISPSALVPGQALESVTPYLGIDFVVTGTIEKRDNSYVLEIVPLRISGEKYLGQLVAAISVTEFLDSFITPLPADVPRLSGKNLSADLILPSCLHCPDPSYDELARREKIQGTCIMEVLISENGDAKQIRPVKLFGYGLDEKAFETLKTWKFRPAKSRKDGTPVPSIVPVEVTFRLF